MPIPHYLAMTAAEMAAAPLPGLAAWMACHFSPYSTGLTNLPQQLPQGSLLILNDRTPIHGHDPERVTAELLPILNQFHCAGLLIDFQNARTEDSATMVQHIADTLPCPVAALPVYREECSILFLPPPPTDTALEEYLHPWKGHALWLETAAEGQTIRLSEKGAVSTRNNCREFPVIHTENLLHCHYAICEEEDAVTFHTWRTKEDIEAMLEQAAQLGVTCAVGLYQELAPLYPAENTLTAF